MGTSASRKIDMGFLPYGSDDESVIEYASFTSLDDIGSATATNTNGTMDFNEDGMLIGTTQGAGGNRLDWANAVISSMTNGGHITFWAEKRVVQLDESSSTSNQTFLAFSNNCYWHKVPIATSTIRWASRTNSVPDMVIENDLADDHVRIDISWNNSKATMYVDYGLAGTWTANAPVEDSGNPIDPTSDLGLFHRNGINNMTVGRVKNVQLSNRPLNLPTTPDVTTVSLVGDSFIKNCDYPQSQHPFIGWLGDEYGDNSTPTQNIGRNRCGAAVVVSELAKRGIYVGGKRAWVFGRGGAEADSSDANPLSERTDAMMNVGTEYPSYNARNNSNVVICNIGTNDARDLPSTTDAVFDASYKAEIDRWDAFADVIVVSTVIYNLNDRTLDGVIDSYNEKINLFHSYNSKVVVADMNTIIGTDSSYYEGDGIHPTASGMVIFAQEWASMIAGNLY